MHFIQAQVEKPKLGGGIYEATIIINPASIQHAVYSPAMTIQAHGSDKEIESSLELTFSGPTKETLKGAQADYVWNRLKKLAP
jgi:hypothetical protein